MFNALKVAAVFAATMFVIVLGVVVYGFGADITTKQFGLVAFFSMPVAMIATTAVSAAVIS